MASDALSPLQIRPRRFGLAILAVTAGMLVAAINYGNNLIFLLAFAMLALIVNSAWQGWRALASLRVQALPPPMRQAGTGGELTVKLESRPGVPAVRLLLEEEDGPASAAVPPGEATYVSLALVAAPRGYLPLPTLTLTGDYPLGLWRVERQYAPGVGQWLYPLPIESARRDDHPVTADETGSRRTPDAEPTRLRAYQPGDPMRRIVFRHYAKSGRLVSRQPEGEPRPDDPTVIDYDRYHGARETRLSAMTRHLLALSQAGAPWTLRLPGEPSVSTRGHGDAQQACRHALKLLARFGRHRDARGFDHVPPGSEVPA